MTSLHTADVEVAFPEVKIKRSLGEGNFKIAYLADFEGKEVVLKVIKDPLDDPDSALPERLRREIEAMKKVVSPRIVKIERGPGTMPIASETRLWYVEPYYEGGALDRKIGKPFDPREVFALLRGLMEGIEALWGQKLVHRDIKPANIVLDEQGLPVLLDLGIALHGDLTPITEPFGGSPRTPAYAAPEQFELRRLAQIDFRTDLFLSGIVGFQALTGKHPFNPDDSAGYVERLHSGELDSKALDTVQNVEELKTVITRLLQPRPNQRYRTIQLAQAALAKAYP